MSAKINRIRARTQNLILGSVTGTIVGVNLRIIFQRVGATDLIWMMFFLLGPAIGYLSGKERERIENLKQEKSLLKENLDKIQESLKKSTQKYKLLVEQANEAIFLTSAQGKILLFNQALALLTGYSKEQLKKMNISQLNNHEKNDIKERKLWLDNGFSRSEERWRKKDGTHVLMDISSKWIRVANYQLILHVARNIQNRSEAARQRYILDMIELARNSVIEEAFRLKSILNRIFNPINKTVLRMNAFKEKYKQDAEDFGKIATMWKNAEDIFSFLASKVKRDLFTSPGTWDLNNVILEELHYLNFLFGEQDIVVKTSLNQGLPAVEGYGKDFSVVLGSVLKAAVKSTASADNGTLDISTRLFDNDITVEISMTGSGDFYKNLNEIFDPLGLIGTADSPEGGGMILCQQVGEKLEAKFDTGNKGEKVFTIRIHLPAAKQLNPLSAEQEARLRNASGGLNGDPNDSLII